MKKRLWAIYDRYFDPFPFPVIALLLVTALVLGYALFSLVPMAPAESAESIGSHDKTSILNNAEFAPAKAVHLIILKFSDNQIYLRLGSFVFAGAGALFLFLLLRRWHTVRVSLLTALMFVTSSWFLHIGRASGTEAVYFTVVPIVLLVCLWLIGSNDNNKTPYAAVLAGLLLYIPAVWILLAAGIIYFRRYLHKTFSELSNKARWVTAGLFFATILPLVYSLFRSPWHISRWLGYDSSREVSLSSMAEGFWEIPKQLLLFGPDDPAKWLTGTPVLDVFTLAMLVLGIYAYRAGYYPTREKIVFAAGLLIILMIGVGQVATITLLLPLLYLFAANGIAYMLQSWFTVFPRNPYARSAGVLLLSVVLAMSSFFHIQRYFVAWPKADSTKAVLNQDA